MSDFLCEKWIDLGGICCKKKIFLKNMVDFLEKIDLWIWTIKWSGLLNLNDQMVINDQTICTIEIK